MITPISPQQALNEKTLPDGVMKAINDLIIKNYNGQSFTLKQDTIIQEICINMQIDSESRQLVIDNKWLDFENIYKKVGWNVVYDGPAYNETYEPTFKFNKIC